MDDDDDASITEKHEFYPYTVGCSSIMIVRKKRCFCQIPVVFQKCRNSAEKAHVRGYDVPVWKNMAAMP